MRYRPLLLTAILLLPIFLFVDVWSEAQDDATAQPTLTPTPAPDYIRTWRADVYFPEGVLFQWEAILRTDVTGVTVDTAVLVVESPSAGSIELTPDLTDEAVLSQNEIFVDLSYFWLFEVTEAPLVFEEVTYEWRVTYSDGTVDSVTGSFVFEDHRREWIRAKSDGLPVQVALPAFGMDLDRLFALLRPANSLLSQQAASIEETLSVVLYPGEFTPDCDIGEDNAPTVERDLLERVLPCTPDKAREIYDRSGYTVYNLPTDSLFAAQREITLLLVQRAYTPLWAGADVPEWFREGIKTLYLEPRDKIQRLTPALVAARSGQLNTLEQLAASPPSGSREYDVWTAQGYGLVVYMAERHGLEAVFTLAREVGNYETFEAAYQDITGEALMQLPVLWETWVFSERAPSIYGLDLYGPPTPTPTPVLSATPPPPTRTPLPTVTPTVTLTITPTPLPPTATLTVTPRPAREVFTPTPTASPTPEPLLVLPVDQQTAQWFFLGIIGFALVLILAAVFVGRGRA